MLDPVVLFFGLGVVGGVLKSDLELPKAFIEALTIFLLLALGLKGGVAISKSDALSLVGPAMALIGGALMVTFAAFLVLKSAGKLARIDAAATAAHYGSVSVITFVVAQTYLADIGVNFGGEMAFYLAVLEVPALVLAAVLGKRDAQKPGSWSALIQEIVCGKSVLLLVGGMAIGAATGEAGIKPFAPLFFDLFKGVVCFLLLELGFKTVSQFPALRKSGLFLAIFGVIFPVASAVMGIFIARAVGFGVGDQTLTAVLFASASYIAAPSAMRVALPQANLGLAIAPVVAVTFPFNVMVGVSLYHRLALALA
jgi:uncharacterized protein